MGADNKTSDIKADDKKVEDYGQVTLNGGEHDDKIQLMTIIGEIEGHDVLSA